MCQNDTSFYCPLILSVGARLWLSLLHYDHHFCSVTAFNDAQLSICFQDLQQGLSDNQIFPFSLSCAEPHSVSSCHVSCVLSQIKLQSHWAAVHLPAGSWLMQSWEHFLSIPSSISCLGQKINWLVSKFLGQLIHNTGTGHRHSHLLVEIREVQT